MLTADRFIHLETSERNTNKPPPIAVEQNSKAQGSAIVAGTNEKSSVGTSKDVVVHEKEGLSVTSGTEHTTPNIKSHLTIWKYTSTRIM